MNALFISGSLRAESSNLSMLRAAAALAPGGMSCRFATGLAGLPHFNPDFDAEGAQPPAPVAEWRELVGASDAFVICTPEYAHGLPGALKNALDWLVSTPLLFEKPCLLINAAPAGGTFAQRGLAEVLRTMNASVLDASLMEPFVAKRPSGAPLDSEAEARLRASMAALGEAVVGR